jgi:DtxR family Mn-dependent transcriptional regulator
MDKAGLTPASEDFLRAVFDLERDRGKATTNELAASLGITAPSATAMAKKLDEQGLVERAPYKGVTLTDRGRAVALEVLRHHRLLERYLADTLGVPIADVHAEADVLEHVLSETVERRIDEVLGFPTHDPHGDPIPDGNLRLAERPETSLAALEVDSPATVVRVPDGDAEVLRYLAELEIAPGIGIEVLRRAPFAGPVTVRIADAEHAIASELADRIGVSVE